jgi:hypothetical protein
MAWDTQRMEKLLCAAAGEATTVPCRIMPFAVLERGFGKKPKN